jgi:hypothetical protein
MTWTAVDQDLVKLNAWCWERKKEHFDHVTVVFFLLNRDVVLAHARMLRLWPLSIITLNRKARRAACIANACDWKL